MAIILWQHAKPYFQGNANYTQKELSFLIYQIENLESDIIKLWWEFGATRTLYTYFGMQIGLSTLEHNWVCCIVSLPLLCLVKPFHTWNEFFLPFYGLPFGYLNNVFQRTRFSDLSEVQFMLFCFIAHVFCILRNICLP